MGSGTGELTGIFVAADRAGLPAPVAEAELVEGRGIEGDRYAARDGTFSKKEDPGRPVTLIEEEALAALARDYEVVLPPALSRRNLLTRGVPLNHLVGREFRVGSTRLLGVRLAEPCGHLEKLTGLACRAGLVHRGGLRAQILAGGRIRVGDPIRWD